MISGLNQEVDILGKSFHFQTEISGQGANPSIRTEVFVGGKVVATREALLEGGGDEETIRSLMKRHHNRTITTFVARAQRYKDREESLQEAAPESAIPTAVSGSSAAGHAVPESAAAASPEAPSSKAAPPSLAPPSESEVAEALRVRRLFGKFRSSLGEAPASQDEIPSRLEAANVVFDHFLGSPIFSEIRVDEQAQCHLVKEQIEGWLVGDRDPWQAVQIWQEIEALVAYLAEINQRHDLQRFDQQLLLWALDTVQSQGMSSATLDRLGALYGRHPHLDQVLEAPAGLSNAAWTARLRSVLMVL